MDTPSDLVRKRRNAIMKDFSDFEWILGSGNCEECGRKLEMTAVMSVEICINAAHFGDLSVQILCPYCDSLYYLHARQFFFKTIPPFSGEGVKMVRRSKLIEHNVNNILEMEDEDLDMFNIDHG